VGMRVECGASRVTQWHVATRDFGFAISDFGWKSGMPFNPKS